MRLLATVLVMLVWGAGAVLAQSVTIEKVVVVQRHGVRAPTKSAAALSVYTRDPWRVWPVAPGDLTVHGALGAQAMGLALRKYYAGLLPVDDCRSAAVWADAGDARTRESGDAVAKGLLPGCEAKAKFAPTAIDPLFSPDEAGLCPLTPDAVAAGVLQAVPGGNLQRLGLAYKRAKAALAAVLYPGLDFKQCQTEPNKACVLVTGTDAIRSDGESAKLDGPLAIGSSLAENLLLEYAEGFDRPGWGRVDAKILSAIMPLHNLFARLTRANPVVATHRGAMLAQTISALMTDSSTLTPLPAGARFVLFLGHDGNLSNLAGFYRLDWTLPGQPDATAPNTALVFERLRRQDGKRYVRIKLFYQPLATMRAAHPQTKVIPLPLFSCRDGPGGSCPLAQFVALTSARMLPDCLKAPEK